MTSTNPASTPSSARVRVWADVGGTFTDCFVSDARGRRSTKVLSSGVTKGQVAEGFAVDGRTGFIDPRRQSDPERFWVGFTLRLLGDDGTVHAEATVSDFDAQTGRLVLDRRLDTPPPGSPYELISTLHSPALAVRKLLGLPLDRPLPPLEARLGTTRGTNALLTRQGAAVTLLTTRGFGDQLLIGEQDRPELFQLCIQKPPPLTRDVLEIDERLDAEGNVLERIDEAAAAAVLQSAYRRGARTLAISLLHAYKNDVHEVALERLARQVGFRDIYLSSRVAPLVKLVARTETTTLDAYLSPILQHYVQDVWQQLGGPATAELSWMTSGGALVASEHFRGADSVLSGPAGGVVALQSLAHQHRLRDGVIGLDMGGTSTDVSLYDGRLRRQFESRKAGVRMLTPMMAIETVAAGGGSICRAEGGRLLVGPDSAGADPGPACYGRGGPLTVTDLNLVLGRIAPERFPFPLDRDAAVARLQEIVDRLPRPESGSGPLPGDGPQYLLLAEGFWKIAVGHMAEAVRTITTAEGVDARPLTLVGFGGAAGQHLTAVASALDMQRVFDHPDASLLSALGMGMADQGVSRAVGVYQPLDDVREEQLARWQADLQRQTSELLKRDAADESGQRRWTVEMRYQGTEASLELPLEPRTSLPQRFASEHRDRFGYERPQHALEWVSLRLEHRLVTPGPPAVSAVETTYQPEPQSHGELFYEGRWIRAARLDRQRLRPGAHIAGPALIVSDTSTLVVHPGWSATMQADHSLLAQRTAPQPSDAPLVSDEQGAAPEVDPVLVEIVGRRLQGIAESMGEVLRRTAESVNVKERRDYSCAVFRGDGSLVANAPHVPVHLGAMGHTVRHLIERYPTMYPGDCYVTNDPFAGGSHLPDVTVIAPVFVDPQATAPAFFVGSRAHHAEIGGVTPGSMPPAAGSLAEEGVWLRDVALMRRGVDGEAELRRRLTEAPYPTRAIGENLADIAAQRAAGHRGAGDVVALAEKLGGAAVLEACMQQLQEISRQAVVRFARSRFPDAGRLNFQDQLDDGTPIAVTITIPPRPAAATSQQAGDAAEEKAMTIDFTGTADVHPNGFNATPGIVTAAVLYVLRCAIDRPLPLNEGFMQAIDLVLPPGLLNPPHEADPRRCPAVVAGNVETSQRVVDVLLGALELASASQGTMNNVLIGDPSFGYYETICGGSGATGEGAGADAVHTHMTNTRITDPEVLESRYPVRLWRFSIRTGSGGSGQHRGGDGVIRQWEFLRPLTLSLLTGRRGEHRPYALSGGESGASGANWLHAADGRRRALSACCTLDVQPGDQLIVETPGGAGWGKP
ncbi:hydantoinase B/oxoprolinase family protein [Roseimaritima sediminicola]|uniref:hydantoinase B/oxoprolinase family protein n=1 Tax=Roseimaritima sediminicola TaxID=2662066 RepID=UPI0012983E3A|nr:hydantoinase B/oxoprolinase family protein [Roseimaritima sediminicola]